MQFATISQTMPTFWDSLIFPLAIIAGSATLGVLGEIVLVRWWGNKLFKQGSERTGSFVRAFRGLLTTWCTFAAFISVSDEFPINHKAQVFLDRAASAILVLSLTVLVVRIVQTFLRTTMEGKRKTAASISIIENIVSLVLYVFGLLTMFRVFGVAVTPFITALGVGGLAVALALQDTLTNFFAGIYVILSKQIDVGDSIRLASGEEGIIEDIAWRVTTLLTSQGSLIIIPNTKISTGIVVNFDKPSRTSIATISFTLAPSADILLFEKIVLKIAQQLQADSPDVIEHVEPELRFISVTEDGISSSIQLHILEFKEQAKVRHEFLKRLLTVLSQEGLLDTMFMTRPYAGAGKAKIAEPIQVDEVKTGDKEGLSEPPEEVFARQ